jgi:PAS domain S-box-containing protein
MADGADESRSSLEKANFKLRLRIRQLEQSNRQVTRALVDVGDTNDALRRIIDSAPMGYCSLDASGRIIEANCEAAAKLRIAQRQCMGRKLAQLLVEQDSARFEKYLHGNTSMDPESKRGIPVTLLESGDAIRVHLTPLGPDTGTANQGYIASLSSVAEARSPLHCETRFQQMAANLEEIYYEADRSGMVLYLSSAYEKIWKCDLASALGKSWFHAVYADDRQHVEEARSLFLKGDPFDVEYRISCADGSVRWVHDRAFLLDEGPAHVCGVARDVTRDRELEEELRHAHKLEALGMLASSIAHDFGNLLQGVMGCLTTALTATASPEAARDYTQQALVAVRGGATLVEQLAKFGRKDQLRPRAVAADEAIASCSKLLQMLLGDQITLQIEAGAPGASLVVDPVQLEQILMNLAVNARDAMPNGGRFIIRTREVRDVDDSGQRRRFLRLEVRDMGSGMDRETQARAFEPFFTTKGDGKGTGLGLATVHAVTQALGGRLALESGVGQGTRFVFHFPVAAAPAELGVPAIKSPVMGQFTGRVLLVEGDWRARMTVRQGLEALGFQVVEAGDGAEALARGTNDLTLLVTDVVLPDIWGTKVNEDLRRRNPSLRVLYVSSHTASYLQQQGLLNEGDVMLQKPFAFDDLALALANLHLGEGAGAGSVDPRALLSQ